MLNHPLNTRDGLNLHLQFWAADARSTPRGTVLLVHGLGEHIERYDALGMFLRERGWWVVGYDQRGHGRSAGSRGHLPGADDLLIDLGLVVKRLRALAPQLPGPLVLLGHSMGGLVAARYVAEGLSPQPAPWWLPVDALALSSPALAIRMSWAQRLLLALTEPLMPQLALHNGLQPEWICHRPEVVQAYVSDPLVHDRITPRLARFILQAGRLTRARASQWMLPTLLQYASADRCVDPSGSQHFHREAPSEHLKTLPYEGLAHEIFNETERERVVDDLALWLETFAATWRAQA
jgi:alpha-beta hydrolase superfamily lysophospholipase